MFSHNTCSAWPFQNEAIPEAARLGRPDSRAPKESFPCRILPAGYGALGFRLVGWLAGRSVLSMRRFRDLLWLGILLGENLPNDW